MTSAKYITQSSLSLARVFLQNKIELNFFSTNISLF